MRSVKERLNHPAEVWTPSIGDQLFGVVVDLVKHDGQYGAPYWSVFVETPDGPEVEVRCSCSKLQREFIAYKPEIGDEIGFRYDETPEGKNWENKTMVLDRSKRQPPIDWEREASEFERHKSGEKPEARGDSAPKGQDDDRDIPF